MVKSSLNFLLQMLKHTFLFFFIIETKPFARVADRCSFNPISSTKSVLAAKISAGVWFEKARIKTAIIPFVKMASLSAEKRLSRLFLQREPIL